MLVRMTQPNFTSSHDWHVQLCCQRSGLHTPKRAVLDQGLTLRQSHEVVSSNLIALCCTGRISGTWMWALPDSPASSQCFARTFQYYRKLLHLSTPNFELLGNRQQQRKISNQRIRLEIETRSSKLLDSKDLSLNRSLWLSPWEMLQWLGFVAVGPVSWREASSYTAVKRLDCAPACHHCPADCSQPDSGAKHLFPYNSYNSYSLRVSHLRRICKLD
jgi:hypothetical protein